MHTVYLKREKRPLCDNVPHICISFNPKAWLLKASHVLWVVPFATRNAWPFLYRTKAFLTCPSLSQTFIVSKTGVVMYPAPWQILRMALKIAMTIIRKKQTNTGNTNLWVTFTFISDFILEYIKSKDPAGSPDDFKSCLHIKGKLNSDWQL